LLNISLVADYFDVLIARAINLLISSAALSSHLSANDQGVTVVILVGVVEKELSCCLCWWSTRSLIFIYSRQMMTPIITTSCKRLCKWCDMRIHVLLSRKWTHVIRKLWNFLSSEWV